ncbi:lysophospholipid acyltransferase family protein [Glycomyces scopariae]|uniref:1-acyl-sn-glycerol-3-phosphate acyltransferase n=1 Tax=Glycomyces sambucus TaxID=380244 RepID=A0A1G9DPT4_9ACTN|nr:lysophospholipid acyltransferase family protein [Glycomyces sambucus]SDK65881.1 1-acyl-sn-glycerol-3-phosphate acyltransferase [Glycomyces sambucus]
MWWLLKATLGSLLWVVYRPKVEGLEHVPEEGPAILASNHLAVTDSFFMPLVVKRRVTFIAKEEYFTGTGFKGWFVRSFMNAVGAIPVDRAGGDAANVALDTGERVLSEGRLFGIYPEGTRSPDGRLYRGKTGVARLALQTGSPVVPVAMLNTGELQPIGRRIPRIGRVRIKFGAPHDFNRYRELVGDRFIERAVTDEVMDALRELSGQDYVDEYAAKVKERGQQG